MSWLDQYNITPTQLWIAGGAVLLLVVAGILAFLWRKRRLAPPPERPELDIPLAELGDTGPPEGGPQLGLYNVPVRLAAVVLAPVGRGHVLADADRSAVLESILPGLTRIAELHQPFFRVWPAQLSQQGFAVAFFSSIRRVGGRGLPGRRGKGTAWSALAGRFEHHGQSMLAGLVLRSTVPNNMGAFTIERDTQWLDLLRIRE